MGGEASPPPNHLALPEVPLGKPQEGAPGAAMAAQGDHRSSFWGFPQGTQEGAKLLGGVRPHPPKSFSLSPK